MALFSSNKSQSFHIKNSKPYWQSIENMYKGIPPNVWINFCQITSHSL